MAGVGLADSFNMVIMVFLLLSILVLLSLWHLVSVSGSTTSEGGDAAVIGDHDVVCVLLATLIHHFGEQIIDFVAVMPRQKLKHWR